MQSKIETIKYSVEAFSDAFREVLKTQHKNVQQISNMFDEAVDHLIKAEEYLSIVNKDFNNIDRDEYGYLYGRSVRNAEECINSIQATMRTNPVCDKLKMGLTGVCLILKSDIEEIQ